jgi:hypothetical protein
VASGEAFRQDQLDRLNRARLLAEQQTGIGFHVRVGAVSGDPAAVAERLLTDLVGAHPTGDHVLVLLSPGQRFVRIVTTPGARRRISDAAASLATLSMTSSFAVGDLVGGLVSGLRQLADAAGGPGSSGPRVASSPVTPPATEPSGARDAGTAGSGPGGTGSAGTRSAGTRSAGTGPAGTGAAMTGSAIPATPAGAKARVTKAPPVSAV